MNANVYLDKDHIPYPCVLLKKDEIMASQLDQLVKAITNRPADEEEFVPLSQMQQADGEETEEVERVSILFQNGNDLLCLGSIMPEQVVILESIFGDEMIGYYTPELILDTGNDITMVIGTGNN